MCFLDYCDGRLTGRTLLQCDGASAVGVLTAILSCGYGPGAAIGRRVASVEKWVEGAPAGARGKPAKVTRQLVVELAEACEMFGYAVKIRPAGDVKPWASDRLLVKAGAADDEQALHGKLRDGYDAARHCLYGAHEAGIIAHPLLRRLAVLWRSRFSSRPRRR